MIDVYDYKYDSSKDPYTYPGTAVLKNKFGIKNDEILSTLERRITEVKVVMPNQVELPKGKFDLKHLQSIHKYLFDEIYDWAGEIRTEGFISKGQSIFCYAPLIESYAEGIFSKMQCEDFSKMNTKQCAQKMAYYLSEVNALHPFREGNGRCTRLFFEIFAMENGWRLSFSQMPHEALIEAMIESMAGSIDPLFSLIEKALRRYEKK